MSQSGRRAARLLSSLAVVAGALAAPGQAARGEGEAGPVRVDAGARGARIEGRVVDEKGVAIPAVPVSAYRWTDVLRARGSYALGWAAPPPAPSGSTVTDGEGRFALADLPPGMTVLIAEVARGGRWGGLATAVAERPVPLRLRVEPVTTRVQGSVTDEHGAPIAQATVLTMPPVLPVGGASILALFTWSVRTQTDAAGRFEVGVAGTLQGVAARRPLDGRWTAVPWKPAPDGTAPPATVAFAPGGPLAGLVVGSRSGRPLASADVIVVARSAGGGALTLETVTTGPDGRLTLPSFPPLAEGGFAALVPGTGGDWQTADASRDARLAVRRGATLAGHVRTPDGRPVAGARVVAHVWDWPALEATTDDAGSYEIRGLPRSRPYLPEPNPGANGLCLVFADVPGYAAAEGTVLLDVRPADEHLTEDFVLHAAATVRGKAHPSDAGGTLLWSPGDPQPYGELLVVRGTTIGEDGSFVLTDLPPGRVTLTFPGERRVAVDGLRAGEARDGVRGPAPR